MNVFCASNQLISMKVINKNTIVIDRQNKNESAQNSGRAFTSLNNILNQLEQNPDLLSSPQELDKIGRIANIIYSRYETRYRGSFQSFLDTFTCCFGWERELSKIDNLRNDILVKIQPKIVEGQVIALNSIVNSNEKPQNIGKIQRDLLAFKSDLSKNKDRLHLSDQSIITIMKNICQSNLQTAVDCPPELFARIKNLSDNQKTEIKKIFSNAIIKNDNPYNTAAIINFDLFSNLLSQKLDEKSVLHIMTAAESASSILHFKNKLATNPHLNLDQCNDIFASYLKSVSANDDAEPMSITINEGTGLPDVNSKTKDDVRKKTLSKMKSYVSESSLELTEEGKEFIPIFKHIKFIPRKEGSSNSFISEGDLVQTPVKMEYNEKFEPIISKNFFYMHSTPAPCARSGLYKMDTKQGYAQYLDDMESVIYQSFDAQINSGAKHILWNYFGMGAFLRTTFKDRIQMKKLRLDIATRFVIAFESAIANHNSTAKDLKFYLTGPTGKNLLEKDMANEANDNYQSFQEAFKECKYKGNVIFCPETDAYVKGQQIADTYRIAKNEVAPVSVINAADPKLLGNKWYQGFSDNGRFNANYAIDENAHRRSSVMALTSFLINGGYDAKGTCSKNIERLNKL